jgi:hypothetical protein
MLVEVTPCYFNISLQLQSEKPKPKKEKHEKLAATEPTTYVF